MADRRVSPFWQAVSIASEMGFVIAIPLVAFGLGGRYADTVFGTGPWLFLAGMVLAIAASTILLIRTFSRLIRDIDQTKK